MLISANSGNRTFLELKCIMTSGSWKRTFWFAAWRFAIFKHNGKIYLCTEGHCKSYFHLIRKSIMMENRYCSADFMGANSGVRVCLRNKLMQVLESSSGEHTFSSAFCIRLNFTAGLWIILHKRPSFIRFYHMVKTYMHIFSVTSRHCEAAGINE